MTIRVGLEGVIVVDFAEMGNLRTILRDDGAVNAPPVFFKKTHVDDLSVEGM